MRRGFTLVELMISTTLGVVVLTAVLSSFFTLGRLMRTTMAESELSLAARAARERLLFRLPEEMVGADFIGLLSLGKDGLSVSSVGPYEVEDVGGSRPYRRFVDLKIEADVTNPDGSAIVRRERVSAPVFGRLQPFQDAEGRY